MGLFDLISNVTDIVTAPVKIAAEVGTVITKPVAKVANETVETVKEILK